MLSAKKGVLGYLYERQYGQNQRKAHRVQDLSIYLAEDKAANPSKNQACEISGQARSTFLMAFSPDGAKMASTHGDHSVRVTDLKTGRCTHILVGHPRTPWCIAFHPSSSTILASGCLGGEVRIWDLHGGGSEVWKSEKSTVIASMAFHPVEQLLVIATSNEILFWDWSQPQPFASSKTANEFERVRWVKFDPLGHHLYTGIANGSTIQRDDSVNQAQINYINNPAPVLEGAAEGAAGATATPAPAPAGGAPTGGAPTSDAPRSLRERYRSLVERFEHYQRERLHTQFPNYHPHGNQEGESSTAPSVSGPHVADIDIVEPRSPDHETALEDARQYASQVTHQTNQALRNARDYAAIITAESHINGSRIERVPNSMAVDPPLATPQGAVVVPSTGASTLSAVLSSALERAEDVTMEDVEGRDSSGQLCACPDHNHSHADAVPSDCQHGQSARAAEKDGVQGATRTEAPTASTAPTAMEVDESGSQRKLSSIFSTIASSSNSSSNSSSEGSGVSVVSQHQAGSGATGTSSSSSSSSSSSEAETSKKSSSGHSSILFSQLYHLKAGDQEPSSAPQVAAPPTVTTSTSNAPRVIRILPDQPASVAGSSNSTASEASSGSSSTSGGNSSGSLPASVAVVTSTSTATRSAFESYLRNQLSAGPSTSTTTTAPSTSRGRGRSSTSVSRKHSCTICGGYKMHRSSHRPHVHRPPAQLPPVTIVRPPISPSSSDTTNPVGAGINQPPRLSFLLQSQLARSSRSGRPSTSQAPNLPLVSANTTAASVAPPAAASSVAPSGGGEESEMDLNIELQQRLEQLHQLDAQVTNLQNRLSERMRSLRSMQQEQEQDMSSLRERPSGNYMVLRERMRERMRERQERLRTHLEEIRQRYRAVSVPRSIPDITITRPPEEQGDEAGSLSQAEQELRDLRAELTRDHLRLDLDSHSGRLEEPTARHSGARDRQRQMHADILSMRMESARRRQQMRRQDRTWTSLQRRHLHPHYAVSILDDTVNRQSDGLQGAINRAIAGAFMGTGEAAVANNIVNLTHRIQRWDFRKCDIPDVSDGDSNVILQHCKIHNDASIDISNDGRMMATFVPSHRGFPDDTILATYSLEPDTLGRCLYTKGFGPNAISVSISPLNRYVMVGLAAKRLAWVFTPKQLVGQVYKFQVPGDGENSMQHISDVMHPCEMDIRAHVSVNSARWLPSVGDGLVYGTNRGDLHICRPGFNETSDKDGSESGEADMDGQQETSIRRNLMQMLGLTVPRTISTATQTNLRNRRSAATQTDNLNSDAD